MIDETYTVLERADRDIRTVANLIEVLVVSHLRGTPLEVPKEVKSLVPERTKEG